MISSQQATRAFLGVTEGSTPGVLGVQPGDHPKPLLDPQFYPW